MPEVLSGKQGVDYIFASYGGRTYVVYDVKLPNGKTVRMAWRVADQDKKALDIKNVRHMSAAQFKKLEVFGDTGEIVGLQGKHPFEAYLDNLREVYGNVSWLQDREFMQVYLMGYAEGWDPAQLEQRLQRTSWYQNRTDAERNWESGLTKAERKVSLEQWTSNVSEAIRDLYGADFNLRDAGITQKQIADWAKNVASGKWGEPGEGFQLWLDKQRRLAEKTEGTPAWQALQQELEQQRAFANRPEDMYEQLRSDSLVQLGPMGVPDDATLRKWANGLVSETKSDADWQQYVRKQRQALYPYIDPDTPWQSFASPYRNLAEETWGGTVDWSDPILRNLGSVDANGGLTGSPVNFYDFERILRRSEKFWSSETAAREGFDLLNSLNTLFQGVR